MNRMIPKKSKMNLTIWKNFTILDLLFMGVFIGLSFMIIASNIRFKWILLIVLIPIAVVFFFSNDEIRVYQEITHFARFLMSNKLYGGKQSGKNNQVVNLIPQSKLRDDGIIEYGEYYAGVLSVGSIEFRLLNEWAQNRKIYLFSRLINSLTSEQSMQLVKIDRPINFDELSERIYSKINEAEQEEPLDKPKLAILKNRLLQIDSINNIEKQYRPYYYIVIYDADEGNLSNTMDYAASILSEIGISTDRLLRKEIAVFLKYCYTRNFDERVIDDIPEEQYLDFVKPEKIKFTATSAEIDDIYSFNYVLSDYPLTVSNAWGAGFFNIDNTKVVLNIKPVDKDKSVKRVDRVVSEVSTKENVNKASEMIEQDTHIETMANLLGSLKNENEYLFDCTVTITGFNNDKEQNNAFRKNIKRKIMESGFKVNSLLCRQFDGFISSSITRRNNLRRYERGINSESLAAVFPFVFTSIIEKDGALLGYDNYPISLDFFKRDKNYSNSNMFAVGKPGSGKSYFAKTLQSLLYSENTQIFVLDPENEYNTLCNNLNGSFIDVGTAITGRLNPFHIYQILTDSGEPAPPDRIYWSHLRFLESFFVLTLPGITPDSLEELNNLVVKCYQNKGIFDKTDSSKLKPEDFPIFDDLLQTIRNETTQEKNVTRAKDLKRLETYMQKFATGGRNANLWNGSTTLCADAKFTVFNFQSLLESKNPTISNGQMLLIMRYLEQQIINIRELNRNGADIHPVVIIDEGYNFIDPNHPIALEFVFQWFKRIRKYNGIIMFLTQNLSDIMGNAEIVNKTSAIINNAQYSFVFSLAPADIQILTDLYQTCGEINETEANEIAVAETGRCFLIAAPTVRISFNVSAGKIIEDLFTRNVAEQELDSILNLDALA